VANAQGCRPTLHRIIRGEQGERGSLDDDLEFGRHEIEDEIYIRIVSEDISDLGLQEVTSQHVHRYWREPQRGKGLEKERGRSISNTERALSRSTLDPSCPTRRKTGLEGPCLDMKRVPTVITTAKASSYSKNKQEEG